MKNLKKVLALVLAFACAFTMFAGAVVYPDVPAGSEYSEAITMLSDLGIIQGKDDGKYHSEDTITRAEACALIARMLTGDPQVSQYAGASNFTDVVKGSWKESVVGYCVVNGITVGVGNNKFEPDRAITDAEFVTMVVRAMGYETTGTSYPYGHISAAQANGLLDDVTVVPSSAALRGEDAQIIYNALFADYARGAKQINTTHGTTDEEYPTIAEDVFGLTRAAVGTWDKNEEEMKTCKAHTWVITGVLCEKGEVNKIKAYPIKDDSTDIFDAGKTDADKDVGYFTFTYEGNIDGLKGYQVELWGEGQHSEPEYDKTTKAYAYSDKWEIKAIKTVKGQSAYDYNATMSDGKNNDEIKLDGVTLDVDKDDEKALNVKNGYSYKLIDWDSDDTIDAIVEDRPDYYEVASVSKTKVKLNGFNGKTAYTLDTDGETDVDDVTIKADLPDDLEEGDVIAVTKSCVSSKKDVVSTWTVEVVEPETKEITKITSKKGVEFDGEKIDVAADGFNFGDADTTYAGLNESTADDWDLWLDANGFIIKMEESDTTWTGYLFVTGADNGDNRNTGSKGLAVISGKNDQNEVLDEVKLASDATVEVGGASAYSSKTRTFSKNVVGKAFHYVYDEDDKEITKLVEVATDAKADDFSYTEKTRAMDVTGTVNRYWAYDSSVIFVVKGDAVMMKNGAALADTDVHRGAIFGAATATNGNMVNESRVDVDSIYDDIDVDDVMAVSYDEIPDITAGKTTTTVGATHARGVRFDYTAKNDKMKAVVLGVDKFDDFTNVSTKIALLTEFDYNNKGDKKDTYDVVAYVAGMEEVETNTIDYEDVKLNGSAASRTKLDDIHAQVNDSTKRGIYVELTFNKDGKVTAINTLDQSTSFANYADATKVDPEYIVVRAVVNRYGADKNTLMIAATQGVGDKLASIRNSAYTYYANIKSDTAYFEIDGKPVINDGAVLNAFADGFKKPLKVTAKSEVALDSFIENLTDEYTDDYVVADVVLKVDGDKRNDLDVAAVYAFSDTVEEYGMLAGSVKVNTNYPLPATVVYNEDHYTVSVDCNDAAKKAGSEFIKVYTTKVENGNTVKDTLVDKYNGASKDLKGIVNAGTYYVEGWAVNKMANEDQLVDAGFLTVKKATMNLTLTIAGKTYTDAKLSGAVKGLSDNNFVVSVNGVVVDEASDYDLRYDVTEGVYHFEFDRYLSNNDEVKVTVKDVANYNDAEKSARVVVTPASPSLPILMDASSANGTNLITVTLTGDPRDYLDETQWFAYWGDVKYSVTRVEPYGTDKVVLEVGKNAHNQSWTTAAGTAITVKLTIDGHTVAAPSFTNT